MRVVHTPIARRHGTGATLRAVSLALVFVFLWFPGTRGRFTPASVRSPVLPPWNWRSSPRSSLEESYRSSTPLTLVQRLAPEKTGPRLALRLAPCGRALSMRKCTRPRRRRAEVAGSPSGKARTTWSMLATALTLAVAIPSGYSAVPPCSGGLTLTSPNFQKILACPDACSLCWLARSLACLRYRRWVSVQVSHLN